MVYVSNNHVAPADLPALIARVHAAISGLCAGAAGADPAEAEVEKPSAAQIRKSVRPDGIISFIDGRAYKTLKRHLTAHGLDPMGYRARYGLPDDYPMVASAYSERRSSLAKSIGLGVPGARSETAPEADGFDQAVPEPVTQKGRRRNAA
ncbi:MucR family transcriptional regulator [Methylobacterium sp. NEAU 140]|uniref:MucR family transcriptional regulator n=1 Tax=Methylobacterium sp. NEAU 140 TaxID=3064945 RepID=UPI0027369366|nr:MucR family transcriptional regulator [Methylobacterium sp. NEAU 140]MDP4026579.1 MucR family transcriptional regulator [Methylobacterium sp. NEAU 140]